jgi:hypothetical protein
MSIKALFLKKFKCICPAPSRGNLALTEVEAGVQQLEELFRAGKPAVAAARKSCKMP